MIKLDNLILIGATGRNVGKTEMACSLIKQHKDKKITALKVTTIKEDEGGCPRGLESCGVCASLYGDFELILEKIHPPGKDTTRMAAAGADKVFWLRVKKPHLEKGIKEFLKRTTDKEIIVCESNSLRTCVEPGLFVVMREIGVNRIKKSCKEVIKYADLILDLGSSTDSKKMIYLNDSKWKLSKA